VLLTRSRLCSRPKPGSSLHLHVLGTPPAFVLSQDQTLREELRTSDRETTRLSQRVVRDYNPRVPMSTVSHQLRVKNLGLSLVGRDPCAHTRRPVVHMKGPRSARRGSIFWHRRLGDSNLSRAGDGFEPGHTPRPRDRSRVRMLLSFQRPSHLFRKGFPSQRYAQDPNKDPGADRSV
jgi:hypothetical protein